MIGDQAAFCYEDDLGEGANADHCPLPAHEAEGIAPLRASAYAIFSWALFVFGDRNRTWLIGTRMTAGSIGECELASCCDGLRPCAHLS